MLDHSTVKVGDDSDDESVPTCPNCGYTPTHIFGSPPAPYSCANTFCRVQTFEA
jgi:transposase-like protein